MRRRLGSWKMMAFLIALGGLLPPGSGWAAWQPTKTVEFVVPAGTGGGADIMARFISPLIGKHKLSPVNFLVVNKSGGAGAEGFLYVKGKAADPHVIIITLDNLFTTPLATSVPFNWKDLTPVARLALDEFILWVNAETPYKTAKEYINAVKAKASTFKMGGTGASQEDQIITIQLEQTFGLKFIYVPFKGGGEVCTSLVGKHVDSTVNNPSECVGHWKANRVRPLAAIDSARIQLPMWDAIPTMKEATGSDMDYHMLRGIFLPPGVSEEAREWYVSLFRKITETPEWKKYVTDNALKAEFLTGPDFVKWLEAKETLTKDLMKKGGLIK
ncbi:MAG: tripartite tricarboxylate transporter substrate-binding protein [Nitrospinota bacterium]